MPIMGTQINSCFRKNLINGILPLKMCCNTRISTQDWWLALTRYQPFVSKCSTPCTSHLVFCVRFIQPELQATQLFAIAMRIKSKPFLTKLIGISSLIKAKLIKKPHQNATLHSNRKIAMEPTRKVGRKFKICLLERSLKMN